MTTSSRPEPRCKHCHLTLEREPYGRFWRHTRTRLVNCIGPARTAWDRLPRAEPDALVKPSMPYCNECSDYGHYPSQHTTQWVCGDCGYKPKKQGRPTSSCPGCRGDFTWKVTVDA